MEDVREKREIVAEAMFVTVTDIKRDSKVNLPDNVGVVNWMKVKEGKFKTYENMEKTLYSSGLNKNGLRTGWSLGKRIDKYGIDLYWNYFTVDWFAIMLTMLKMQANILGC